MKKFRINEGSSSSSTNGHHHGMRSPLSLSLASSSTSINHQAPERLSLASNAAANMVHSSSEPQRANQFYHTENNFILSHNDNINWRDEADGSEEEECRLNALPNSAELQPPSNLQSNLFGQHSSSSNLLTHQAPLFTTMVEHDLRSQGLNNNCPDSARAGSSSTDKNLESNFKGKQLRETEFCINRIEDLLASFKNLWKTGESDQHTGGGGHSDGHVNNINSNVLSSSSIGRKSSSSHTVPKMTNNSNLSNYSQPNFLRVSNQFSPISPSNNLTIPKNTHQVNDSTEENLRNSKNDRKLFANSRHAIQSDFQPHSHGSMNVAESDFNEPPIADHIHLAPESRIDQFYHLLNAQINTLHGRLEQLALSTENNSKENYSQANPFNFNDSLHVSAQHLSPGPALCDIDNCCVPSELHAPEPDDSSSTYLRKFNQQIYQLLMFQNYQINQQHKLIESWINTQQKWIEKQPGNSSFKVTPSHSHRHSECTSSNHANNMFLNESPFINNCRHSRPDITLNNQTEPRRRANNFHDNFRSHSHQNKLQSNRDIGSLAGRDPYGSSHHGSNCSNSCINIGPCNKNSRSQSSFAGFSNYSVKSQPNNFMPTHGNLQMNSANFSPGPSASSLPHVFEKKLNTNVGNNLQQLNKILSMVGKMAETDSGANPGISNLPSVSRSKGNLSSSRLSYSSPFNSTAEDNKNSYKRKKTSNVEPSLSEQTLHEDLCEFDNEEDDPDSIDMEPHSFESVARINGNSSEPIIFGATSSTNACAPTALPSFHMDKCSFQVPLTISPHTGAIRKKPIYDCNFKFAATDNQKLSVIQHHAPDNNDTTGTFVNNTSNLNESVRPLMPAEGRSSEQLLSNAPTTNAVVNLTLKPKLSNSSQKYSTRPPITGAGNESIDSTTTKPTSTTYAHSSPDLLIHGLDDDIKWNKQNSSDTNNNATTDKITSSNGNDMNGQEQRIDSPCSSGSGSDDCSELAVSRTELSSTVLLDDERLLDGSTEPELSPPPIKSKSKDGGSKCESSFVASSSAANASQSSTIAVCTSSTGHTSLSNNNSTITAVNKSLSSGEMEVQQLNSAADNGHSAANGRFLPDEVIRLNGHHQMADNDDEDLDDDKDTDVRLLSLAGNAVEVRSTVRLSGDGEQGL